MNKKIASEVAIGIIALVAVLIGVSVWLVGKEKDVEQIDMSKITSSTDVKKEEVLKKTEQPSYSRFENGYSFEYPSFFKNIEVLEKEKMTRFNYTDENGIEVYLQVVSGATNEEEENKKSLLERGWEEGTVFIEDKKYVFLYHDLNKTRLEGVNNCSFSYSFTISYDNGKKLGFVHYRVSQKDLENCKIYSEPYYDYYINIFNKILSTANQTS